jgi:chromosome segregation ATPase
MNVTERLTALTAEINDARKAVRILEEQLAFQLDVAEDARLRALVSETPLADREYRIARDDLERLKRSRDDEARRLRELEEERDQLLDRLAG